jgi:hypothetical protein
MSVPHPDAAAMIVRHHTALRLSRWRVARTTPLI